MTTFSATVGKGKIVHLASGTDPLCSKKGTLTPTDAAVTCKDCLKVPTTTGNPADTTKEITTMTDAPATGKVPLKDAVANAKAAAADKAKDKPASAAKPKAAPAPKPKYVEKTVLAFNDKWTADDKTAVKTFAKDNAVDGMVEAPNGTYIRLCAGQTTVGWLNKNRIDLPGGKKVHLSTGRAPK